MLLVGLTGGIGSGKSTVARMFAGRGALVVDADAIAREVVAPGTPGFDAVVERFGRDVVAPDGTLDRPKLASIVFADEDARQALNEITHPLVGEEMMRRVGDAPEDAVVVMDVPLLAESARGMYGFVVVVEAPLDVRLDRLEERGVEREDARARIATQASDDERRAIADVVLDNSGDLAHLERQVDELWPELVSRAAPQPTSG